MTRINEPELEPPDSPERQGVAGLVQNQNHQRVDWLLIFLLLGGILTLTLAIAVGLLLLLAPLLGLNLQNLRISYSPLAFIFDRLNLLQFGLLLLVGFLVLALVFYLLTRWRVLQKEFLWPAAGCPSCGNEHLQRVRRTDSDHLYDWLGIPVGRYHCSACNWNNLRIRRGPIMSTGKDDWPEMTVTGRGISVPLTEAGATGDPKRDDTEGAATSIAQLKWTKRLNSPVDLSAFEGEHGIEEVPPTSPGAESASGESESVTEEPTPSPITPPLVKIFLTQAGGDTAESPEQALTAGGTVESEKISIEIMAPSGLKLRADPHPEYDEAMIGRLEADTELLLLIELTAEDGSAWQPPQRGGQGGWVLVAFVKNDG